MFFRTYCNNSNFEHIKKDKLTTRNHLTSPRAKIVINESTEETTSRSDVAIHMRKVIVSYWGWRPTMANRYEFGVTNAEADKQAKIAAIIYVSTF